jgi:hypothetical protein
LLSTLALALPPAAAAQYQSHQHPAPEKLGKVTFRNSCGPGVQAKFERAVALLHSFAYAPAEQAFRDVSSADSKCAMAYWGEAMTHYHELWEPAIPPDELAAAKAAVERARQSGAATERERGFIAALAPLFHDAESAPVATRAANYSQAMRELAARHPDDAEAQIFYALSLVATASPADKTHSNQKKAVEILEPLYRRFPDHPGLAHYLIHACDNAEMAQRGVAAARAYSKIAPSAPHALHMPSHIFTRLGLWDDSIASNLAARAAAHQQGDPGEELHAMDYLVYAYLQSGRDAEVAGVLAQLRGMPALANREFKIGYSATAIPIRYAVERREWKDAAQSTAAEGALPQVEAIAAWARAVGLARGGPARGGGNPSPARPEMDTLQKLEDQLQAAGNKYWAGQVHILFLEASAWVANAESKPENAIALMRSAATQDDAVEKLSVTPGPIVPAREQLGDLLLELKRPQEALAEYEASLATSPGRRGGLAGALQAARLAGDSSKASRYELALHKEKR